MLVTSAQGKEKKKKRTVKDLLAPPRILIRLPIIQILFILTRDFDAAQDGAHGQMHSQLLVLVELRRAFWRIISHVAVLLSVIAADPLDLRAVLAEGVDGTVEVGVGEDTASLPVEAFNKVFAAARFGDVLGRREPDLLDVEPGGRVVEGRAAEVDAVVYATICGGQAVGVAVCFVAFGHAAGEGVDAVVLVHFDLVAAGFGAAEPEGAAVPDAVFCDAVALVFGFPVLADNLAVVVVAELLDGAVQAWPALRFFGAPWGL